MFDKLTYINHLNESIVFGENGILIDKNDIRDYEWNYNSQYQKIAGFTQKISKKKLPVLIYGDKKTIANRLLEVIEKDVLANEPGKLYAGNYYLSGYFIASAKTDYNRKDILKLTLTFVCNGSNWINSSSYVFRTWDEGEEQELGLGYAYDYPYDYTSPISTQNFRNLGFMPANFIINIYGPVVNPSVIISGHVHSVNIALAANEILTINSVDKTIVKTDAQGRKTNQYANRDLDHYVFEKIPAGLNTLVVNPVCNVDITVLEERSEPAWT